MNPVWLAFSCGLFIGAFVGLMAACLLHIAKGE